MSPFLEESLLTYGQRVVEALKLEPNATGKIFDLVDTLNITVDTLNPIVGYLVSKGYLDQLEADPKGNHTVKVTAAGAKVFS